MRESPIDCIEFREYATRHRWSVVADFFYHEDIADTVEHPKVNEQCEWICAPRSANFDVDYETPSNELFAPSKQAIAQQTPEHRKLRSEQQREIARLRKTVGYEPKTRNHTTTGRIPAIDLNAFKNRRRKSYDACNEKVKMFRKNLPVFIAKAAMVMGVNLPVETSKVRFLNRCGWVPFGEQPGVDDWSI